MAWRGAKTWSELAAQRSDNVAEARARCWGRLKEGQRARLHAWASRHTKGWNDPLLVERARQGETGRISYTWPTDPLLLREEAGDSEADESVLHGRRLHEHRRAAAESLYALLAEEPTYVGWSAWFVRAGELGALDPTRCEGALGAHELIALGQWTVNEAHYAGSTVASRRRALDRLLLLARCVRPVEAPLLIHVDLALSQFADTHALALLAAAHAQAAHGVTHPGTSDTLNAWLHLSAPGPQASAQALRAYRLLLLPQEMAWEHKSDVQALQRTHEGIGDLSRRAARTARAWSQGEGDMARAERVVAACERWFAGSFRGSPPALHFPQPDSSWLWNYRDQVHRYPRLRMQLLRSRALARAARLAATSWLASREHVAPQEAYVDAISRHLDAPTPWDVPLQVHAHENRVFLAPGHAPRTGASDWDRPVGWEDATAHPDLVDGLSAEGPCLQAFPWGVLARFKG